MILLPSAAIGGATADASIIDTRLGASILIYFGLCLNRMPLTFCNGQ